MAGQVNEADEAVERHCHAREIALSALDGQVVEVWEVDEGAVQELHDEWDRPLPGQPAVLTRRASAQVSIARSRNVL